MAVKRLLIVTDLLRSARYVPGLCKHLRPLEWDSVVLCPPPAQAPGRIGPPPDLGDVCRLVEVRHRNVLGALKSALGLPEEGLRAQVNRQVSAGKSPVRAVLLLGAAFAVYPDELRFWRLPATRAAEDLLRRERFDAVLSTSPPVTCHRVARAAKDASGTPWVADLRDLWAQNAIYPYPRLRRRVEGRLEARTFRDVDAFTAPSEDLAAKLRRSYPHAHAYVLRNGFDPGTVNDLPAPLTEAFTITFTGTIYAEKQDASKILQAVRELVDEGRLERDKVSIRFYGPNQRGWLEGLIEQHGLAGAARAAGAVSSEESIARQRESQVLLALGFEDADEPGILPGKVYEYLAARRPILATGGTPGEELKQLLDETAGGKHATDVEGVKALVLEYYEQYTRTGKVAFAGDPEAIDRYSQVRTARDLAAVLERL